MLDYNSSSRINIDDFVRIITEFKISISITDIQMLFHSYELYKNGLFFYEEMFKDLKKIYHNEKRYEFLEAMYNSISDICKIQLRLVDLKSLFNAKHCNNNNNFTEIKEEETREEEFNQMVDSFEFIMRLNRKESYLPLETFVEFFKYFGFGIDDDNEFISTVKKLFSIEKLLYRESEGRSVASKKSKQNDNFDIKINEYNFQNDTNSNQNYLENVSHKEHSNLNSINKNIYHNNKQANFITKVDNANKSNHEKEYLDHKNYKSGTKFEQQNINERKKTEKSENQSDKNFRQNSNNSNNFNNKIENEEGLTVSSTIEKLKNNLKNFGRKSLLSLIKHFKCYDNGTKFLTKSDFIKVIRDFRLNLTASEIENLFDLYVTDKKKMLINFQEFINVICKPLNETRKNLLLEIYEKLTYIENNNENLDLILLKSVYNPKGNFFGSDSEQVYTEFIDCIELYHFNYKNKRNNIISLEEFLEFYRYIGFLVDSDDMFFELIHNEYSQVNEIIAKKHIEMQNKKALEDQISFTEKNSKNNEAITTQHDRPKNSNLENIEKKYTNSNNDSYYSNENRLKNKQAKNEHEVTDDILRQKLEKLNLNSNDDDFYNHQKDYISNVDDRSVNERPQSSFNRNNKFTKEMKEKAHHSDGNLVNYVVNKNFKNNFDKFKTPILNGNDKAHNVENKDFESLYQQNLHNGSGTPIPKTNQNKNNNIINNETHSIYKSSHNNTNPKTEMTVQYQQELLDPHANLADKLRKRGLRGLMNLHKQFILNCQNLNAISLNDFTKVLRLQRLDLIKEDYESLFNKFKISNKDNPIEPAFLNFAAFIRSFKAVLNDKRLQIIETTFSFLDEDKTEMLFLDDIKMKFNVKKHPEVLRKRRNQEEILMEFIDCFDMNYAYLSNNQETDDASNFISFQEFANFYEYVSFLYDRDDEFIHMVESVWNLD